MKAGGTLLFLTIGALALSCFFTINITDFQRVCAGAGSHDACPMSSPLAMFAAHLDSFHTFSSSNATPFIMALLLFAVLTVLGLRKESQEMPDTRAIAVERRGSFIERLAFYLWIGWYIDRTKPIYA